ncbi:helix-turn-helix domain-containing protein [Paenibacillus sepulcri]|uniref:Helix-turn-helix domain-containing protein n=1 Tax=Paenibacillus sepulcri TaxID=359917 RepID=A0ABS7C6U0_9BACL|nr:helix-turn-helix domain-containing protein [Paenibacillus sepulcri]
MYKSNFTKVFKRFLISYIVILLIPLLAGFISARVSIDIAKSSSIESSMSLLSQSKMILERRMDEVDGFARQLSVNHDLNRIMARTLDDEDSRVYRLWEVSRDISAYAQTNDFLNDFYIYLNLHDVVITPGSVFNRPEHYYNLHHYADLPYEQWKQTLNQSHQREILPSQAFIRGEQTYPVVTYVQSLQSGFTQPQGTVVVLIDQKKISDMLQSIPQRFGGWAYIADPEGNIMASSGIDRVGIEAMNTASILENPNASVIQGGETLLISDRSDYNGWYYIAGIPRKTLMENASIIKRITWIVTGSTFLIGLAVCLLMAYRNSSPIHSLTEIIREQIHPETSRPVNEYDFLRGNISRLITSNKFLEAELKQQIPLLRDAVMKRLLHGEFSTSSGIEAALVQAGIEFQGDFGYVGIIQINGYGGMESPEIYDELNAARLLVKQTLHQADSIPYTTDLHLDKIAILFPVCRDERLKAVGDIEKVVTVLIRTLSKNHHISLTVSMGGLFTGYSDIYRSLDEAKQTMEYCALMKGGSLFWYHETTKESALYYYPIDLELRLMNVMKTGEISEAIRILRQIFDQNFRERDLSAEMAHDFVDEIKATLLKSFDPKVFGDAKEMERLKGLLKRIQLQDGLTQVRGAAEQVIAEYGTLVLQRKKDSDHGTVKRIKHYLEDNYGNPELNLHLIAEREGRPEKFISQLFKEQIGEYVSEFLENIRLHKAAGLLLHSDRTIEDISSHVGYHSPYSFRRAFKRLFDVTPNHYRKMMSYRSDSESVQQGRTFLEK